MITKALTFLALYCSQTSATSSCQDETSLLQVTSEMKYGGKKEEADAFVPPAYKKPTLTSEGHQLRVSWKLPELKHPVKSTAVQVRVAGEKDWKFVDSEKNLLVPRGGSSVSAPDTTILISGVDMGKQYEARVAMKNDKGWGGYSPASEVIALAPRTVHRKQDEAVNLQAEQEADELIGFKLEEDVEDKVEEAAADDSKAHSKAHSNVNSRIHSSKAALEAAARLTAENAVMARSAVDQAEAKDKAAQKEVEEKKAAATKAIQDAYQKEKSATEAAEAVKQAIKQAKESKIAAKTAEAKKEAAEMMLSAAEELAGKTKAELQAARRQSSDYTVAKKFNQEPAAPGVKSPPHHSKLAHTAAQAAEPIENSDQIEDSKAKGI